MRHLPNRKALGWLLHKSGKTSDWLSLIYDLGQIPAAFLVQFREYQADDLSIVGRIQAQVALLSEVSTMSKYTKEDIIRMVREDDVEFIRMQFTDIFGQLKNVAITASQIEKAVNNEIMIDGSSIEGFVRIQESDQYLYPDLDSFTVLPWRPQHGKVARLICDVYNPDGTPFVGDPRGTLKRVLKKAADMGYTFNVGPECEFFLFQTDDKGNPIPATNDEAGYFDLGPLDHGESTRREICMALEKMGFEIEVSLPFTR